jgi:hypothetical protein
MRVDNQTALKEESISNSAPNVNAVTRPALASRFWSVGVAPAVLSQPSTVAGRIAAAAPAEPQRPIAPGGSSGMTTQVEMES